jgi:hypothetical protein
MIKVRCRQSFHVAKMKFLIKSNQDNKITPSKKKILKLKSLIINKRHSDKFRKKILNYKMIKNS